MTVQLTRFDITEHLDSEEAIAEYINAVIEEGDFSLYVAALGDIARARGMTQVAEKAGLGRESLYKALAPGANPRFETIMKVTDALGLKLHAVASSPPARRPGKASTGAPGPSRPGTTRTRRGSRSVV